MKKATHVIRLMVVIICFIVLARLFQNCLSKKNNFSNNEDLLNHADEIITEEDLLKKQYEENLAKSEDFKQSVANETEIILLSITDRYTIAHDRTPQNNKVTEWLFDSNISIEVRYNAIISIPTNCIEITLDNLGNPIIHYDISKIAVKAVDILDIISKTNKGFCAKEYTPSEVSALTLIATDQIKENTLQNEMFKFMAEQNLVNYLELQSLKLHIFNIKIIPATIV